MEQRHKDTLETDWQFAFPAYIACPKCTGCAVITKEDKSANFYDTAHLATCSHCGYNADTKRSRAFEQDGSLLRWHNNNFPLWLKVPCAGNAICVYNPEHLLYLESFVSAKIRERKPDEKYGWSNKSMISRLPAWIKSKKNRDDVLRAIDKLWIMAKKEGLSRPVIEE
ncbi:hypothetical protein [Kiloniella sp.]|uniref:hypothetical protein n=1 Tax=Kiloniella sp. TaxID=1938587 RepID=UPI003B023F5E